MNIRGSAPLLVAPVFLALAGFHRRSLALRLANAAGEGHVIMRSGRVVDAILGAARGVGALFPLLQGASSGSFEIFPAPSEAGEETISLSLGEILRRLAEHSPSPDPTSGWIMEGDFSVITPLEILQLFEANQRYALLRFFQEEKLVGEAVVAEAGLLSASTPGRQGPEAIYELLTMRPSCFTAASVLPTQVGKRPALAAVLVEGMRRCAEHRGNADMAAEAEEADAIRKRLDLGEVEEFCRCFLARQYLPGGGVAPPEIVARLCVDTSPSVRRLALRTLERMPEEAAEAIASDPQTSPALLRYFLCAAGNTAWAAAAAANPRTPLAVLVECAPSAEIAVLAAIRGRSDGVSQQADLAAALAKNPRWPEIGRDTALPQAPTTPAPEASSAPAVTASSDLLLERPQVDEREEKVKAKLGPKEIQYVCRRGTLRDKMRLVCGNNAEAALEIVRQPGIPETFILGVAESPSANPMALRYIAGNRQFTRNSAIMRALVFNPKTPPPAVLSLLPLLRPDEWAKIAANRDLPEPTRHAARNLAEKRAQKKKGG